VSAARPRLAELMPPEVRPYLTYSFALHLALALAATRMVGLFGAKGKSTVYTIDFVGGPAQVMNTSAGAAASPPEPEKAAATPQTTTPPPATADRGEFDEFGRRKGRKNFVLPRPSLLKGAQAPQDSGTPATETKQADSAVGASGAAAGQGAGGDAGVATDMPNFPYPWYITRVRQMLWNQWMKRMGGHSGETVVVFSLMPNGSVVDLRTETSSGDGAMDLAALAAVQDAAPYPPLPNGFSEPFLKVHVTLKSQ
jgi:protein TonB